MKINHNQLKQHIKIAYQKKRPLYIWGTTGIGKSESTKQVAQDLAEQEEREFVEWNRLGKEEKHNLLKDLKDYFIFMDLRASQFDPSDLRGLPSLNSHETVEWKVPFWLYVLTQENCKAIVFCDELNLAPPSVHSAFYQLINDRALGEVSLAEGIFLLSAGNRLKDKANVNPLSAPLKNRFLHLTLQVPNRTQWVNWAMENEIDPRIISFIQFKPDLLFKFDPESKDKAFPTPRSWEYASDLIKGTDDNPNITHQLVSSAVGEGASMEFKGFLALRDEINLEEYLENPEEIENLTSPDLKHSLILLTVERWKEKKTKKLFDKILELTKYLEDEFAVLLLRLVKQIDPEKLKEVAPKSNNWTKISKKYSEYLLPNQS